MASSPGERFRLRPLEAGDYRKERFETLASQPEVYKTMVVEELKFLRACGKCGHIEDVVVDDSCRGHGLGLRLIQRLVDLAEEAGCYKVILDCAESNAAFYAKAGLSRKEVQMVKYF